MPEWLLGADRGAAAGVAAASVGLSPAAGADRAAMDAILLVLRTGMQWDALKATGVETIERLRALRPGIRAIAMSGLPHMSDEAHAAGADAFLCKQDIHAYLVDAIHAVAASAPA
jgi:DNA-binding NarL/FixJ family response regulator